MIPLRYVPIVLDHVPLPSKRGTYMALHRAVVLSQLHPSCDYYPMNIAHIALAGEASALNHARYQQLLTGLRLSYGNLANRQGEGTNPQLTGAQWLALLGPGLHRLAAFMAQLKQRMEEEPGTLFALSGNQIVPYPDQSVNLDHFYLTAEARAALAEKEGSAGLSTAPQPEDAMPLNSPQQTGTQTISRRNLRWRGTLVFTLMFVSIPSALAWYWWFPDEMVGDDIQEIIAPIEGPAYVIAAGKRYEVGDRVRFEGQIGVIRSIQRAGLKVGDRFYEAPALFFFGEPMRIEGNSVVYPGSQRGIAGNFNLVRSEALDSLEPGYLSWLGGFLDLSYICLDSAEALTFWQKVSGTPMGVTGHQTVAVPEHAQLIGFLESCNAQGARVEHDTNFIEVVWQ